MTDCSLLSIGKEPFLMIATMLETKEVLNLSAICKQARRWIKGHPMWRKKIAERWGLRGKGLLCYGRLKQSEWEVLKGESTAGKTLLLQKAQLLATTDGAAVLRVSSTFFWRVLEFGKTITLTHLAGSCSSLTLSVESETKVVGAHVGRGTTHLILRNKGMLQVHSSLNPGKWEIPRLFEFVQPLHFKTVLHGGKVWMVGVSRTHLVYRTNDLSGSLKKIETVDESNSTLLSVIPGPKQVIAVCSRDNKVYCLRLGKEREGKLKPVIEARSPISSLQLLRCKGRVLLGITTVSRKAFLWDPSIPQKYRGVQMNSVSPLAIRYHLHWGFEICDKFAKTIRWNPQTGKLTLEEKVPRYIKGSNLPISPSELGLSATDAALVVDNGFFQLVVLEKNRVTVFQSNAQRGQK